MEHILLADHNPDLRSALRLLLKTRFGLELIVEASDMEQVLTQVEASLPDCIILDWELPGYPTRKRVPLLRALVPGLKVIALSIRPESKQAALQEGVDAFVCKTESPVVILEEIRKICQLEEKRH